MDAIVIRGVGKQFRKKSIRREYTTFKSELVRWLRGEALPVSTTHLTALHDINLTVKKGQTIGLMGRNGSGKSTLLKLVTGIYTPTSGTIHVNGRISALLELGAGFHPDFSGRENILINGIIMGMSRREIRSRMEEIIEFSELGDFVDQPVRTYSSGMYARLAFSIATHVDPEILIIDEILAVGDEHFAHKSASKMEEFRKAGKTTLLVTHDLETLQRRCDEAAWLDGGTIRASGVPSDVVAHYRQAVAEGEARGPRSMSTGPIPAPTPTEGDVKPAESDPAGRRWGTREMSITEVRIQGGTPDTEAIFSPDSPLSIALDFTGADAVQRPVLEVSLLRDDGLTLWTASTGDPASLVPGDLPAQGTLRLSLPRIGLAAGSYRLDVAAYAEDRRVCDFHRGEYGFVVRAESATSAVLSPVVSWELQP